MGESRYVWRHGITPRKYDSLNTGKLIRRNKRISFTFRSVRRKPCECEFAKFCDRPRNSQPSASNDDDRPAISLSDAQLENKYVYEVYDRIANHFDKTRQSQWKGVKKFLDSLDVGSMLLDVGCGNGKYLGGQNNERNLIKFGCDRSLGLCEICREKNYDVFHADCLSLPVNDNRFDAVMSIAVIHHLSSEDRRRKAVEEMIRVLKPGGSALIYVWAFEQSRKGELSHYLQSGNKKTTLEDETPTIEPEFLPIHENRTEFKHQNTLVPWDLQNSTENRDKNEERLLRFYHVFKDNELQELCQSTGNCRVKESFYEQGNWCVVIQKM